MIIYYENLIAFGIKVSLVFSGVFGSKDFVFTCIRGLLITLPIYFIKEEEEDLETFYKAKNQIEINLKKTLKKSSLGNKINQFEYKRRLEEKIKKIPRKTYFISNPKRNFMIIKLWKDLSESFSSIAKADSKKKIKKDSISSKNKRQIEKNNAKYKIKLKSDFKKDIPIAILKWVFNLFNN